ncbi:MAG: hypothetical protein ACLSHG_12385 [Oscillospiraceae bacterium]
MAALRGHDVTLLEASDALGGALRRPVCRTSSRRIVILLPGMPPRLRIWAWTCA